MCCYTSFKVSSVRAEAQTMNDCRRVRITEKCASVCESECLSLWIRPHTESSFVSSSCYLRAERHFSFVFAQEHGRQKQSFLSFPHIDAHKQTRKQKNAHTHTRSPTHSHTSRQTHVRTNINMHAHTHTHTHSFIPTRTHSCQSC